MWCTITIGFYSSPLCGQSSYQNTPLSIEETSEAVQSARRGVDYSDESTSQNKKQKPQNGQGTKNGGRGSGMKIPSPNTPVVSGTVPMIAKVALVLIAIGLLVFIVVSLVGKKRKSSDNRSYDAETEAFAKLNLEDPLQAELGKGNYRLACRILYLQMLQEMVSWRAILWRNEKTNWDYYAEARSHSRVRESNLYSITNQYDYLWYGEQEPNLDEFNQFKLLINQLRQ